MVRAAKTKLAEAVKPVTNGQVAASLEEAADLLSQQGANEFRVRAYRRGAGTVRGMAPSVAEVLRESGAKGLLPLPGIGESLARSIEKIVTTGRMPVLERLRADAVPTRVFTTVADIGPKLAERIHSELGIESLAELEAASWDGRLARVPGMGQKRVRAVRESLAGRFHRPHKEALVTTAVDDDGWIMQPAIGELLDIDDEYRRLAEHDRLIRVAPRRFNPGGQAWLPILHAHRKGSRFVAMFSNTARAHELGVTHDWVVIYREGKPDGGPWTVVTSRTGRLQGKRVVRGREAECAKWYGL